MQLTVPAFVSATSAILALVSSAALAGTVPSRRWRQNRLLAVMPLFVAVYAACDVPLSGSWPAARLYLVQQAQAMALAAWGIGWVCYADLDLGPIPRRLRRALIGCLAGGAALQLVRPLLLTSVVQEYASPFAGVRYRILSPTLLGSVTPWAFVAAAVVVSVRYSRASLRSARYARLHLLTVVAQLFAAINDALAPWLHVPLPFLLDLGFDVSVLSLGYVLMRRWRDDMEHIDALSAQLEARVEKRTRELEQAMRALSRTEKLAAIGRLAAGVAHEINNPAAVVAGNLDFLLEMRARGTQFPAEAVDAIGESREATGRISAIVRRLLTGSRAARQEDANGFDVAAAVEAAADRVRMGLRPEVRVSATVPAGLQARGGTALLEQVLFDLLQNGVQAIPSGLEGKVEISAVRDGSHVLLRVSDDGAGIEEEALARLFEPFFSTRPLGEGAGLSLSVSLALLRTIGGDLLVDSDPGRGTTATVVLQAIGPGRVEKRPAAA